MTHWPCYGSWNPRGPQICFGRRLVGYDMPRVYRTMKKAADGLPVVEQTAKGLGVRVPIDIAVDSAGITILNGNGMSVAPNWRVLKPFRIPERLRDKFERARGPNELVCFRSGDGHFATSEFATGLQLIRDSETHGCLVPKQAVPLNQYQHDLAATRASWQEDET